MATYNAIAGYQVLLHVKIAGTVYYKAVKLNKSTGVKQHFYAFTGSFSAGTVQLVNTFLSTTQFCLVVAFFKFAVNFIKI